MNDFIKSTGAITSIMDSNAPSDRAKNYGKDIEFNDRENITSLRASSAFKNNKSGVMKILSKRASTGTNSQSLAYDEGISKTRTHSKQKLPLGFIMQNKMRNPKQLKNN